MEAPKKEKSPIVEKKINIRATVSPYLSKRMDRLVERKEFSSVSDLVSVAVTEFLVKFPDEEVKA